MGDRIKNVFTSTINKLRASQYSKYCYNQIKINYEQWNYLN